MRQKQLEQLLRLCDHEAAADVQVNLRVTAADRALLRDTAKAAYCTQMGVLRVGIQLAAEAVAKLNKAIADEEVTQ